MITNAVALVDGQEVDALFVWTIHDSIIDFINLAYCSTQCVHGVCSNNGNSPFCSCDNGWTGNDCSIGIFKFEPSIPHINS